MLAANVANVGHAPHAAFEGLMPNYRRYLVPGATYFFTVVTESRSRILISPMARQTLRDAIRSCRQELPFEINAIVLLPEHIHAIWTLPSGDANYSKRWGIIKKTFTTAFLESGGREQRVTAGKERQRRRGVWQPRFWEHMIRDETDFDRHFDYVHYNPVNHGHVTCVKDWPFSSFHRWARSGVYASDWGCAAAGALRFDDLDDSAMEF
jgi:putative transposase